MARIRTIKPEFFTSLTIAALTPEQRLTFIGIWTHVDDEGRCIDDPRLIKAAIWPLDNHTVTQVDDDLDTLYAAGLIVRYTVTEDSRSPHGGLRERSFITVAGWSEHQVINRPGKSKLPPPENGTPRPPTSKNTDSLNTHGALTEDSRQERNREQGTGNREIPSPPTHVTHHRATAREQAAQLNNTATTATAHQLVHNWHTNRGHHYTRTELNNLTKATNELLADGANPNLIPTTLDHQHTEGHSLNFLPHAYRQATKQHTGAGATLPAGAHGGRVSKPSTTDQRVADIQALKHQMLAAQGNPGPGTGSLRLIEGAAS